LLAVFAAIALFQGSACAKPELPEWLESAMKQPINGLSEGADSVQLVEYMTRTYSRNGECEMEVRTAVKILSYDGKNDATLSVHYNRGGDKIRDLRAWLIFPNGEIREYDKDSFMRREASNAMTLFTETWVHELSAVEAVKPGCVLACSYRRITSAVFASDDWCVRMNRPVLNSTLKVTVPEGWTVRSTLVNNPNVVETNNGRTYTCISTHEPALKEEDGSPINGVVPFVGYDVIPSARDRAGSNLLVFDSWNDVARYVAAQSDPHCEPDAAIAAKVEELTAGCETQWQKIQAVCRYVQATNYISIGKNLNEGGGYVPNDAAKVFARNYGDCKDKVALLRAMLSCLGVESFDVSCQMAPDGMLSPDRPSPYQFNHAIAAFRVGEGIDSTAVVSDPVLGRLMVFDPTNGHTPVGYLGSMMNKLYFLVSSPDSTGLLQVPELKDSGRQVMNAAIDADGRLYGLFDFADDGDAAGGTRQKCASMSTDAFKRLIAEWLRKNTRDTVLNQFEIIDDLDKNIFRVEVEFDSPNYAKRIGADKLLFRAFMQHFPLSIPPAAQEKPRQTPVALQNQHIYYESSVRIPEGFAVESLPRDITLDETFGRIELRSSVEDGVVHITVSLDLSDTTLPAEEYERLRNFYKIRNKALQATVMLRRVTVS
jgi:transglutaminase-like putative cysteine protease